MRQRTSHFILYVQRWRLRPGHQRGQGAGGGGGSIRSKRDILCGHPLVEARYERHIVVILGHGKKVVIICIGPSGFFCRDLAAAQLETTFLIVGGYDDDIGDYDTVVKYDPEAESFNQLGVKVSVFNIFSM